MFWLSDHQWFLCAVLTYGLSSIYSLFLWRKGFQQDNRINYCLLLGGFGFHTLAMIARGVSLSRCPVNNLFEAIVFIMWTIVSAYLVIGLWSRLRFLGAFVSPLLFIVGVFGLMPALDTHGPNPEFHYPPASLHAALVLLSYGAFGLSSVAAIMFLVQEHNLKFHKWQAIFGRFPSIQRLELIVSRCLVVGIILLTIGLGMTPSMMQHRYGIWFNADAKILWSGLVWFLYASLLFLRWRFDQGGRRLAWGSLAGFTFVMLTFWGTNLMSRIHQQ